jgi:ATP-binding cassette subfamily F protein 3
MDELRLKLSAYDHIAELMPDATEAQKRARIAAAGFGADKADTPSEKLSGGEKARLLFALATFHAPHLLIFDEPTNHLDVDSREALIHALNDYEGAVILISHDRHLLEATVDRLWVVRGGAVTPYDGDLESYRQESLGRGGKQTSEAAKANGGQAPDVKLTREEERRQAAQRRAELAPLRKQLAQHERCVEALQKKIAAIDFSLGDHSLYEKQPDKARSLTLERAATAKELKIAEEAWFEASLAYEEAAAAAG